jgi:signal transduction histidine kinase
VADVAEQLRHEAERERVSLVVELDPVLGAEPAARQLRDVVFNLVDNAIDAAEHAVIVDLQVREEATAICVRDDGPGVATSDDADRIFEPFFTTKSDGTGMGLAIADALVGDLGGEVRYERADGWTCFVVLLPPPSVPGPRPASRVMGRDVGRSTARR